MVRTRPIEHYDNPEYRAAADSLETKRLEYRCGCVYWFTKVKGERPPHRDNVGMGQTVWDLCAEHTKTYIGY